MKTEVIYNDEKQKNPFPKLMIAKTGAIVFFAKPKVGQCLLQDESGNNKIGEVFNGWNMSVFKDFDGKITLEND